MQIEKYSILDIKLHYYDDSLETTQNILTDYGITDDNTIQDIHQYILEEPGNYLKYYMGYLLLIDLKEKAKTLMGSDFTEMKFHEFILNAGPSDFENLEKRFFTQSSSSSMDSRYPLSQRRILSFLAASTAGFVS